MAATPQPEEQPAAPRLAPGGLPELDSGSVTPSANAPPAPVEINENTSLEDLTPSQIYQLNQDALDNASSTNRPLIASVAPMDVLRAEYENGSQSFVKQIDFLKGHGYAGIRRTRGDGDCFYRSLAFAYIERILTSEDLSLAVMTAISTLDSTLPMLDAAGFEKIVYEDFYDVFVGLIRSIGEPDANGKVLTPEGLLEAFQDSEVSNSVVVYLRLLTSAQIRYDPDSYEPFLFHPELGYQMKPIEFCNTQVEATGKEADHVQVTALSRVLRINVRVAYLDGRNPDGKVDFVEFINNETDVFGSDPLVLLYRPGHYDILDKRDIEALGLGLPLGR
ncbi:cysteine proteinase [Stereum hirsutum FP-91666 SS1]|uniref:cysteine proteinase n=1 Tax=Stereum hirsutum (strain FP-91666) TaxID=721885 RepID=UPI000444A730|nr:cysteine proteinase [Stereum hirsutum FP-91666 SS1]EIM84270.1 cysteine proteinase [Stereum hirsutum FP-91666 SS1]